MGQWELWQWHNRTAVGEADIIAKANQDLRWEYEAAQRLVSETCEVLTTIEQAKEHFLINENGAVKYKSDNED